MLYIIKSLIVLSIAFLLANDLMFNKKRHIILKVIEFIGIIFSMYIIFTSVTQHMLLKEKIQTNIKNSTIFGSPITIYSIDGTNKQTMSIGSFLYGTFVRDVFDARTGISEEEYKENNNVIIFMAFLLMFYWILMLVLYEKEEKIDYKIIEDEKLFEKYNPLIAGCVTQNRNVLGRDIVAVVLGLINKEKIKIRHVQDPKSKKVGYRYMISENPEVKVSLDMIERDIYDWIFEEIPNYKKGNRDVGYIKESKEYGIEIDLIERIKALTNHEDTPGKVKELNLNTKKRLDFLGANKESVPFLLKLFNTAILFFNMFLVADHIIKNGLDITLNNLQVLLYMFIMMFIIMILPVIYTISLIFFEFIRVFLKNLQQITEGYSGRKLIAKSVSIVLATVTLVILYSLVGRDFYIVYDILLIGITCLIIFTDDYMLKHEYRILNDYYNLKRIENKIQEYSMMKRENVEYIELWGKYFAYSVAFGIPIPITNEIDVIYEYTPILTSNNIEGIYWVCKSYLEEMWDMDFSPKKSKMDIFKIINKYV